MQISSPDCCSGTIAVFSRCVERETQKMKAFWHQMKHELSSGRNATLLLAIIASFIAWIVTDLLRLIFS